MRNLERHAAEVLSHGSVGAASGVAGFPEEVAALLEELEEYKVAIEQQRAQMETLVASLPLASLVVDDLGVIHEANDRAAELFGLRSKDLIENHSLLRLVGSMDREMVLSSIREQSPDGITRVGPITIGGSADELVDFHMAQLPKTFHADKRIVITAIERTRHYYNLRRVLLLETLVDAADLRILAFDNNQRCLFANKKELDRIGISEAELVGKRRDHWMSDAETIDREKQDQLVLNTAKSCLFEEKIGSDGDDDHFYVTQKFPLVAEDAKLFGVGIISTEVKRKREDDPDLDITVASAGENPDTAAVVIADTAGAIIGVNPAFSQVTGFVQSDMLGRPMWDLIPEQYGETYKAEILPSFNDNGAWYGEFWIQRSNGSVCAIRLSIARVARDVQGMETIVAVFEALT